MPIRVDGALDEVTEDADVFDADNSWGEGVPWELDAVKKRTVPRRHEDATLPVDVDEKVGQPQIFEKGPDWGRRRNDVRTRR